MLKKHDIDPDTLCYTHTHTHTASEEQAELVVARQHHGQRLAHQSPIRAAVTSQPVSQT